MEFFGKQAKIHEKIVVTIASDNPSFTFETYIDAVDFILKVLNSGYIVEIEKKKVTL